ncbi:hypothetical protein KIW84_052595 [Lathyrus oleraceus]|uniref:PB1-like domain-containing protein n=1 Tax=Pisum sativum TaxID=3888 RepID=A0A9D4WSI6_PEA|nr:hypothetical protein KIW84_052595 [Pisum sativum]
MFLAKERFWNVEWFFCVTLNRGQISPFYRRTKTENEKSYLFKKNGNNGWEGSNVQKSYLFKKNGDDESSYGGSVAEVKCDVDKWSYFEVLGIVNELGYEESRTVIYKDPTVGLFTLSDDKGAQELVNLCKVIVNVDETEDVIRKLVKDVLNCKVDGVTDLNNDEVRGINLDVNGAEHISEGEVGDINIDVNGDEDMSKGDNNVNVNGAGDIGDSDDVSFQYDSVLDAAFQDSDEDSDGLVEEDIT